MRKWVLILLASMIALLAACGGGQNHAGDTNSQAEEPSNTEDEESATEEEATEPKLEIVQSTGGTWKDSIDNVWVHSSAIFENTGDVPVKIGETQMNFKDTEGGILGTDSMVYAVPGVVHPGEQAYISQTTILDGITDPAEYEETSYNYGFDVTEEDPDLLEVSGVKGVATTNSFGSPYKVTGVVINTTEELQDDIRLAAALFAEDGELLGVLRGSVDVGVNPDSEAGFELSYPELPKDIAEKVSTVEVKAYGWTW